MCGGKTVLALWALLLLCSVVHGQLEALRQVGDAREQYVRAFRLVWAVEETRIVSSSPVERTQIEQEAEFLQHELQARGAKDVSGVKQQLLREAEQAQRPVTTKSDWYLEWGAGDSDKECLLVVGERRFGDETVRFPEVYGDGWGVQVGEPASGRIGIPPLVWCCTGHCSRHPALNDGGLDIQVDELSVVACLNILRMNDITDWEVVRQTPKNMHFRTRKYKDTYGTFEVDIVIDVERGGAPLRVVKRNADYEGQVEVIRYVQSGGYWLPTTVKSIFRTRRQNPGMTRQRTWQLRGVQTKRGFSLNLIASSPTVIHWGLRDLRAYGCDLTLPQTVALASDKEVFYNWEGRLPTVDEVREMLASRQRKQSPKGTFSAWYRVVPPVLLILIGAYWYWRVRRAERRA
jgi:hypothetical protein